MSSARPANPLQRSQLEWYRPRTHPFSLSTRTTQTFEQSRRGVIGKTAPLMMYGRSIERPYDTSSTVVGVTSEPFGTVEWRAGQGRE
jgi:hypothetical protein